MADSYTSLCEKSIPEDDFVDWQESCGMEEHELAAQCPSLTNAATDSEHFASVATNDDMFVR